MSRSRIAVLRCEQLPFIEGIEVPEDADDVLFADDSLLIEEFRRRGIDAEGVSWMDSRLARGEFDAAIVRSTWDYIEHLEAFPRMLRSIEASGCKVFNSPETIEWNSSKKYLFDLQKWGVPTVPTYMADDAEASVAPAREDWSGAVLKPIVGVGGKGVERLPVQVALDRASSGAGSGFLVQPFVESVTSEGDWSFIFIGGSFSHAILRRPKEGDYRAHAIYGGSTVAVEPSPEDRQGAEDILSKLPFEPLYVRLDLIRFRGRLVIMELELIEPILYMKLWPKSVNMFVDAALDRI